MGEKWGRKGSETRVGRVSLKVSEKLVWCGESTSPVTLSLYSVIQTREGVTVPSAKCQVPTQSESLESSYPAFLSIPTYSTRAVSHCIAIAADQSQFLVNRGLLRKREKGQEHPEDVTTNQAILPTHSLHLGRSLPAIIHERGITACDERKRRKRRKGAGQPGSTITPIPLNTEYHDRLMVDICQAAMYVWYDTSRARPSQHHQILG